MNVTTRPTTMRATKFLDLDFTDEPLRFETAEGYGRSAKTVEWVVEGVTIAFTYEGPLRGWVPSGSFGLTSHNIKKDGTRGNRSMRWYNLPTIVSRRLAEVIAAHRPKTTITYTETEA